MPAYWLVGLAANVAHYVISALDVVTPTDRWLNVWCIWHTYLETLQYCGSRRRIGWSIQDFREMCVSHSLSLHLETKMPWCQTPSRKKKAIVFTTVMTNARFSKACEIFIVRGIESFKFVREFHTPVCYCGDISTPRNAERNKLWLVVWHVGKTASWVGFSQ